MTRSDRPAEQESLPLGTAVRSQEGQLTGGFNALRDHPHAQASAHIDDGFDNTGVIVIRRDVEQERSVDLQGIDWKAPHIAQAGIPRAEIVQREANSHALQGVKHRNGRTRILHQESFREFEFQIRGIEACAAQRRAHVLDEILRPQFNRGDVDGHLHLGQAGILPGFRLATSFAQDPPAEGHNQARSLPQSK